MGLSATASREHSGSAASREKLYRFAALHIYPKVVLRPPEAGEPGTARCVPADKDAVLILLALIERTGLNTRL